MAYSDSTMMCRTLSIPGLDEAKRANGKAIVTVCISDAEDLSRYAFSFGAGAFARRPSSVGDSRSRAFLAAVTSTWAHNGWL